MDRSLPGLALVLTLVVGAQSACDQAGQTTSDEQNAGPDSDAELPAPCEERRYYDYIGVTKDQVCPNLLVCKGSDVVGECPDVYRCDPLFLDQVFIHRDLLCDGTVNCPQADDEIDCPGIERTRCDASDYGNKTFYTPEQRCDGHAECNWADDEKDCPDSLVCPVENPMLVAIPVSRVCDGAWDCSIDEYDCPGLVDPFLCKGGRTIDRKFTCDGIADCNDASDELDPSCEQIRCSPFTFIHTACANCSDGTREGASCSSCQPAFLPKSRVCDGVVDCRIKSWLCESGICEQTDESDCP